MRALIISRTVTVFHFRGMEIKYEIIGSKQGKGLWVSSTEVKQTSSSISTTSTGSTVCTAETDPGHDQGTVSDSDSDTEEEKADDHSDEARAEVHQSLSLDDNMQRYKHKIYGKQSQNA